MLLWIFVLLFAVLMSLPWLVPHLGVLALVGFIPLLLADDFATQLKMKRFWVYSYAAFVLWNAFTTFWVCNATIAGGIFAVLANALQMSLIWGLFRVSRKRMSGVLPYIFLAVMWIAWERFYYSADISWPWLVLGNAFARTTHLVQWYSVTGTLGGSLWIWAVNLAIFGILSALSDGLAYRWNPVARSSAFIGLILVLFGPIAVSKVMYKHYSPVSEGTVDVVIGQPNLDPYHKFGSYTQAQQDSVLLGLYDKALEGRGNEHLLLLAERGEALLGSRLLGEQSVVSIEHCVAFGSGRLRGGRGVARRFHQRFEHLQSRVAAAQKMNVVLQCLIIDLSLFLLLDMDDAHSAQPFEELLIFLIEHQEGELFHFGDHASSSFLFSSSSSARFSRMVFRIFCEDLERFSSSSMKRLILRMASA